MDRNGVTHHGYQTDSAVKMVTSGIVYVFSTTSRRSLVIVSLFNTVVNSHCTLLPVRLMIHKCFSLSELEISRSRFCRKSTRVTSNVRPTHSSSMVHFFFDLSFFAPSAATSCDFCDCSLTSDLITDRRSKPPPVCKR